MLVITPKLQRRFGTLGLIALVAGLFILYRWAEPTSTFSASTTPTQSPTVTMRLENAPFESYTNGHKSWSVWADKIDLERTSGAAMSMIQSATIEGIRDGALYKLPGKTSIPTASSQSSSGIVTANFSARKGRYSAQNLDSMPPEWAQNYTLQWQFRLMEDVKLQTREGEKLTADSMTLFELVNRRTGLPEHRIVWDSGAEMMSKKVHVHANQMRMDPGERLVECMNGVRCSYPDGAVQTERAFLSLKDSILRCPDPASGTDKKMQYTADGLVMDIKKHKLNANRVQMKFPVENFAGSP